MIYSARVLEYFLNPKHAYRMDQPDGIGVVGDPSCGDFFVMYIRVRGERLTEVSYQIFGCPAAIATCDAAAEMATGKTLDEAQRITDESVAEFLGGLPEMKLHCSNSAADALHCAIVDYRAEAQGEEDQKTTEVIEDATR
jgi:nitrogen fixation NifU-like protein